MSQIASIAVQIFFPLLYVSLGTPLKKLRGNFMEPLASNAASSIIQEFLPDEAVNDKAEIAQEEIEFDAHFSSPRKKMITVASYSGGGVRGIIPARISAAVERETGKPISELFDLFVGTSSGAIVASALNCPEEHGSSKPKYRAEEIVQLFKDYSAKIFPPTPWYKVIPNYAMSLFLPWYSVNGLRFVLQQYCQNMHLSDSLKEIAIPAAEMPEAEPWWFTKRKIVPPRHIEGLTAEICREISMVDVLEATTAAPSYFPYKAIQIGAKNYYFMDGGTFANNPASLGSAYAQSLFGSEEEYFFSCFGTGDPPRDKSINSYYNSGLFYWSAHFATASMNLSAREAFHQLQICYPSQGREQNLYICQPEISNETYTLDDSSPEILEKLIASADAFLEENEEMMRQMCNQLLYNSEAEERVQLHELY